MTKLEKRIAQIAEATGKTVVIGRQGHKDEWFATCENIEHGGPSAMAALDAVVAELHSQAADAQRLADAARARTARVRDLLS